MAKDAFLRKIRMCYRALNAADSDDGIDKVDWTAPAMAYACRHLDALLSDMLDSGILSATERQEFYDAI